MFVTILYSTKFNYFVNIPLTWRPGAPGSTPESNIAIVTLRPSYNGFLAKKLATPVSLLGTNAHTGNSSVGKLIATQRTQNSSPITNVLYGFVTIQEIIKN